MTTTDTFAPVGAIVRSGYWGDTYRVLEHIADTGDWRGEQVRIQWLDGPNAGSERTHSTPFDPKRDRIIEGAAAPTNTARYSRIQTLIEHPEGIGLYGSDMLWRDANYAVCQSLAGWYRVPDQDAPHVRSLFGETHGLYYGEYVERAAA